MAFTTTTNDDDESLNKNPRWCTYNHYNHFYVVGSIFLSFCLLHPFDGRLKAQVHLFFKYKVFKSAKKKSSSTLSQVVHCEWPILRVWKWILFNENDYKDHGTSHYIVIIFFSLPSRLFTYFVKIRFFFISMKRSAEFVSLFDEQDIKMNLKINGICLILKAIKSQATNETNVVERQLTRSNITTVCWQGKQRKALGESKS